MRECLFCGIDINDKKANAKYCSRICKSKAANLRVKLEEKIERKEHQLSEQKCCEKLMEIRVHKGFRLLPTKVYYCTVCRRREVVEKIVRTSTPKKLVKKKETKEEYKHRLSYVSTHEIRKNEIAAYKAAILKVDGTYMKKIIGSDDGLLEELIHMLILEIYELYPDDDTIPNKVLYSKANTVLKRYYRERKKYVNYE